MKKTISVICLLILSAGILLAQNKHFTVHGTILYEKTANMYALYRKTMGDNVNEQRYYDQYVKTKPQFTKLRSNLVFSNNKTLFTPIASDDNSNFFNNTPVIDQNNTIFTDYNAGTITAQKKVYDETYLLKDSTRSIKWKLTDETRTIAGYPCKRANGIMLDSVYIVAFYTELIPLSGGPESFNGLPGMILSVVLPHDNLRWDALTITDVAVEEKALNPPKKGKPVNNKILQSQLQAVMKKWGTYGAQNIKGFTY